MITDPTADSASAGLAAIPREKRLGAFYTPDSVATALVRWALDGQPGKVLEPSFGGCSFLHAAIRQNTLLEGRPQDVVGVDIDRTATATAAAEVIAAGLPRGNIIYRDFLTLRREELGGFRAVVGNPPFVRHHWLTRDWRDRAQQATAGVMTLSQRASAWAYFVLHATSFLDPGGRLAFVLPAAVLQAAYAAPLVGFLRENFEAVRLLRLRERLFAGADEEVVVLLASGFGTAGGAASTQDVTSAEDLELAIAGTDHAPLSMIKSALVPKATRELVEQLLADDCITRLGDVATVLIGVVTGANDFFVRPKAKLPEAPGTNGVRLVSRSAWLQGPVWTSHDLDRRERAGEATRLLAIDTSWKRAGTLAAELDAAESKGVHERHHTSSRGTKWWVLKDIARPHAFLPYMGSRPRGLVLNRTHATCTNAIHRVTFDAVDTPLDACASTWTSLFSLRAELFGRHYGGGVFKLEPGVAKQLPVLKGTLSKTELHRALEEFAAGQPDAGRTRLDRALLQGVFKLRDEEVVAMRDAADRLAQWRTEVRRREPPT